MKVTRVYAQDKSIGGKTHGVKWRYDGTVKVMDVPEKVGLTLIGTGDWMEVKTLGKKAAPVSVTPKSEFTTDDADLYLAKGRVAHETE